MGSGVSPHALGPGEHIPAHRAIEIAGGAITRKLKLHNAVRPVDLRQLTALVQPECKQ